MRRWRESAGTIKAIIGFVAWVGLWAVAMRMVGAASGDHPALFWCVFSLIVPIAATGGLVIFWKIFDEVDFWRRGYRVRQLGRHGYFRWSRGPKECVYEERAQDSGLQSLPFVRVVLDDGYPALCQVPLPRDEDWNAQTPP